MQKNFDTLEWLPPLDWYNQWWIPNELLEAVRRHNKQIPGEFFFNNPKLQALREAYVAALFGSIRSNKETCRVKLLGNIFPDFEIEVDSRIYQFELTEADKPDRRRGREYRQSALERKQGIKAEPDFFNPEDEEVAALPAIVKAVEHKAQKFYNPPPHLLVYVNLMLFKELPHTGEELRRLIEPYSAKFTSVWLLWGANVVQCWPEFTHITPIDIEVFE